MSILVVRWFPYRSRGAPLAFLDINMAKSQTRRLHISRVRIVSPRTDILWRAPRVADLLFSFLGGHSGVKSVGSVKNSGRTPNI